MSKAVAGRLREQRQAADPFASAWVSANAGSGKTFVLTDRVMRLLLAGTAPARLLCITFTKAAAAEMANRLHDRLGEWVTADDAALTAQLTDLMGRPPEPADLAPARRLFARALEAPGGLKIQTIHAFCESVLRRFPLEAEVPPHFDVMDERAAAETMAEAIGIAVGSAAADGGLLARIAARVSEADFADLMAEVVARAGDIRQAIERHGSVDATIAAQYRAMGFAPTDDAETIRDTACRDDRFDGAGLAFAAEILSGGSKTDAERAARIRAFLAAGADRSAGFDDYCLAFLTKKNSPRSALATKAIRDKEPAVEDILRSEQARLGTLQERLRAMATAARTADLVRVAAVMIEAYAGLKRRRAHLDYDDLILRTRALLYRPALVPWVLYKLDGGLDHILVDEAQDTSPPQWDIVTALADAFFDGEGARGLTRTVFAVGDEKQSIYSFQGADPARFDRMRAYFSGRTLESGGDWHPVELQRSFRSTPEVLDLVDRVFAEEAARDGLSADARPTRHSAARAQVPGLVELWPPVVPEPDAAADPWDAPLDQLSTQSAEMRLAVRIAEQVSTWLAAGETVGNDAEPIKPGDILILVRRRNAFVDELIRQLKIRAIPVAGSDRMILTEQIAVMDLLAIGRFVLMPEDDLCLAELLKSPFFNFDDADLFDLAHGRRGSLWAELGRRRREKPTYGLAYDRLQAWLGRADYQPPFEFFAAILSVEGGRRQLQNRLGADALDPIEEFLTLALSYERQQVPSLQGFVHWVSAGSAEIKRDLEQGRGEVRVMTVHGAKGLQAPVVILPDSCGVPGGRFDPRILTIADDLPVWAANRDADDPLTREAREAVRAAAMREYRRLLYVALTRAEDRLYVCGYENSKGRGEGCWYDLVEPAFQALGTQIDLPWGDTGLRYGRPRPAASPTAAAETGKPDMPAWLTAPAPPEPTPPRPRAPSRPAESEPAALSPLVADDGRRFRRGVVTHKLLQMLPGVAPEERRPRAERYLARRAQDLSPEAAQAILKETFAILEAPEMAALFGPESRAEVPITGLVGDVVVSGQVDRLLVSADRIVVADFKTNRPPPKEPDQVPALYLRQMSLYRALLRKIYPDREVRCLLIWTDGARIMRVPDRLMEM